MSFDSLVLESMKKSMAFIQFNSEGMVEDANEAFLQTLGYKNLSEIIGQHHRIFCDDIYVSSLDYKRFWNELHAGNFQAGEFSRRTKQGKKVWIQATYNPIFNQQGKVEKIVKFALDVTVEKHNSIALSEAMSRSQAYIEFNMDGIVQDANKNFIDALGYQNLSEIKNAHHQIFCEKAYVESIHYKNFWAELKRGQFQAGQFKRVRRDGEEVWIQATYNPILDLEGKVVKVVKYATDITKQKKEWFHLLNTLSETSTKLALASEELTRTAGELTSTAEKTSAQAASAAAASEELSVGMKSVSGSTIELTQSIKEITQSANLSANKANESQTKANHSNENMERLGHSSDEIGSFVKIISSIAQQTNLLALNATIEAARAGEAGRGFAVVANEVKELAKQSAKAAEEISSKINNIQNDTRGAISIIDDIAKSIDALSHSSSSISAAVEQQSATMGELSRIVSESNQAVENVSQSISFVSKSAVDSKIAAEQTLVASRDLYNLSENLSTLVKKLN